MSWGGEDAEPTAPAGSSEATSDDEEADPADTSYQPLYASIHSQHSFISDDSDDSGGQSVQ